MTDTTNPPVPPSPTAARRAGVPTWLLLVVGVVALVVATVALTATLLGRGWAGWSPASMMGGTSGSGGYGPGMMGGYGGNGGSGSGNGGTGNGFGYGPGMMGGYGGSAVDAGPQPGDAGFVAGTVDAPRVIQIIAGPGYTFTPSSVPVQRGETITFQVTGMGPLVHEFMVGPAGAVAADEEGTPEIEGISMMTTQSLTYTFDTDGPYAFACHAEGHYEAGMAGTITVVD